MRRRSAAAGRVIKLAGACPGQRDQLANIARRHARVGDQYVGQKGHQGHRDEIPLRIERQTGIQARVDGMRGAGHEQRVAVGHGFRNDIGSQGAAGTRPIVDDHRLAHALGEFLADDARERIGRGPGRKRHHEADRP